eukprot:scaffold102258_cov36-Tisochrysis_lutea.AAC.2
MRQPGQAQHEQAAADRSRRGGRRRRAATEAGEAPLAQCTHGMMHGSTAITPAKGGEPFGTEREMKWAEGGGTLAASSLSLSVLLLWLFKD